MKLKIIKVIIFSIMLLFVFQLKCNASEDIEDIVVVLDPGHGGSDTGAIDGGILEKNVTWKIATRVKQKLDEASGITAILVRQENENPTLYERGACATRNGADLLVSFHINSTPRANSASGAEVYITGDINSSRYNIASKKLGKDILNNFNRIGLRSFCSEPKIKASRDGELYSDGVVSDYYGIIRNPMYYGIPGVLVEHCFINNDSDRINFLTTDAQINSMADQDAYAIIANKELFRTDKSKNCVNSELKKIEVNASKTHITGEIVVVDWLYGMQSVPVDKPIIKLVPTDGSNPIWCYVSKIKGNTYYFDTWLEGISPYKKYTVEVSTQNIKSIPYNNKMTLYLGNDKTLYKTDESTYSIKNNMIQEYKENLKYAGDVTSEIIDLGCIDNSKYITGKVVVVEWVNGKSTVPKTQPIIKIKSLDNKYVQKCFVKQIKGNTYYFDACIQNIDTKKQYIVEVSTDNEYNISSNINCTAMMNKEDNNIGKIGDYVLGVKSGKIFFDTYKYVGNMNSELKKLELNKSNNNAYINGKIVIVEWIDGKSTVPNKKPKMKLRSVDKEIDLDMFVVETNTNTYYFDRFIEGIDTTRQYELIVESGNENNISEYRQVKVYFNNVDQELGKYNGFTVKMQKSKIIFESVNLKLLKSNFNNIQEQLINNDEQMDTVDKKDEKEVIEDTKVQENSNNEAMEEYTKEVKDLESIEKIEDRNNELEDKIEETDLENNEIINSLEDDKENEEQILD